MWYGHVVGYYLAVKRDKVLLHAMTSVNLENNYVKWKTTYHINGNLYESPGRKHIKKESRFMVALFWRRGRGWGHRE